MDSVKTLPECTGVYLPQPEVGNGILSKDAPHPEDIDRVAELFQKMMEDPFNPALAIQMQYYTYEKALPWQLVSSVSRNCLSGCQTLMNGQV